MIYLDTSVVLAQLLAEDRRPPADVWAQPLVSSRLLQYETWTRLHARGAGGTHGESARQAFARISFLDLAADVLARATEPFPLPVRTLDALHLASAAYLTDLGLEPQLATYDGRLADAARALGLSVLPLP